MHNQKLPRFFSEDSRYPVDPSNAQLLHVVDRFFLFRYGQPSLECCVVLNSLGVLQIMTPLHRVPLSKQMNDQLSFDEVSGGAIRELHVQSLHLMVVHRIEQPANICGVNDPIRLQGYLTTTFGPIHDYCQGSLTVSRADFIDGINNGAKRPFQYGVTEVDGSVPRCFGLLVPGNSVEDTVKGNDLVLVYPMLPLELIDSAPGNEVLVMHMISEVLSQLQFDLNESDMNNQLRFIKIPEIQNNQKNNAVNAQSTPQSIQDLIKPVINYLGGGASDTTRKKPHNDAVILNSLLKLSANAFDKIEGWPPPSTIATRAATRFIFDRARLVRF